MFLIVSLGASCWSLGWSGSLFGTYSEDICGMHSRNRTFTRDAKCVHEREQALRLIRAVIVLPAPPPPSRPASRRRRRSSHSRPRSSQSRQATTPAQESVSIFVAILTQRVPLTDGILRSLVSVAENQDDALRTICMQTLIEIGKSLSASTE
jgi:rapamycin-insensitive companion of mTOR